MTRSKNFKKSGKGLPSYKDTQKANTFAGSEANPFADHLSTMELHAALEDEINLRFPRGLPEEQIPNAESLSKLRENVRSLVSYLPRKMIRILFPLTVKIIRIILSNLLLIQKRKGR